MVIKVKVTPNSKKNSIRGFFDNILYLKISKPPSDNKANEELIKFLEEIFLVKGVKIVSGEKTREKLISLPLDMESFSKKIKQFLE